MVFADLLYEKHYSEFHVELVDFLKVHYPDLQSGLQGDSWVWIFDDADKVAIDTFSSMKHQVKCSSKDSPLLQQVMATLAGQFTLRRYADPELEAHEDC